MLLEKHGKVISTLCYVKEGNKFLMLHRIKKDKNSSKRFFRGLGGKAEKGESPFECVKREVQEEAGIKVNPIWRGVVTFSNTNDVDWEAHVFVAEGFEGRISDCPEGDLCWVDKTEIMNLEMPEGDKILMQILLGKNNFHAKVAYGENKKLLNFNVDYV